MEDANSLSIVARAHRPRWLRLADVLSVALFALVWGALALRLVVAVPPGVLLLTAALLSLPMLALADLLSGLVHWFADRYLEPTTPVFGPMLIEPFREHHRDPRAITHLGFCEVCGNNGLVTLLVVPFVLWLGPPQPAIDFPTALQIGAVLLACAIFLTNQVHSWAHLESPPRVVAALQRRGALLHPKSHGTHHRGPHDHCYCITTGWLNAPLDRIGFFASLESALARIGLNANDGDLDEAGRTGS